MAGSTTPGSKNWGDKVAIQKLTQQGGGFKRAQGTSGPMVQATTAGRPANKPLVPVTPVVNEAAASGVPKEHEELMQYYADSIRTAQAWAQKAQAADAGPRVQYYANLAQRQMAEAARAVKDNTPDWL